MRTQIFDPPPVGRDRTVLASLECGTRPRRVVLENGLRLTVPAAKNGLGYVEIVGVFPLMDENEEPVARPRRSWVDLLYAWLGLSRVPPMKAEIDSVSYACALGDAAAAIDGVDLNGRTVDFAQGREAARVAVQRLRPPAFTGQALES